MANSSRENIHARIHLRVLAVLFTLGVAGFCLSTAQAKAPIDLSILKRDGYGVVPISRPRPNDLIVTAKINNLDVGLVLDTGWGGGGNGISLHSGYAKLLGVRNQPIKGYYDVSSSGVRMGISRGIATPSVWLGKVQIVGMPLYFGMFSGLTNEDMAIGAGGFVSAGFLHATSAIVDLENLCLYIKSPGKGRRAVIGPALKALGLVEAPFTANGHGQFLLDVEINGAKGKMVMDTGATLTGVDKRFASHMKAHGYNSELFGIDAAGVRSRKQRSPIEQFKISEMPVYAPEITLSEYSCYSYSGGKVIGVLGMDILGRNWSIIDFGQQKLYFARAK